MIAEFKTTNLDIKKNFPMKDYTTIKVGAEPRVA